MAPTISEKGEPGKEAASCGKLLLVLPTELLGVNSIPFQSNYFSEKKVNSLSRVGLFATPWTLPYQAPPSMGFSRQ